jgi:two-component system, chemotaxis family, protein-glutamate methylesterase/glutaminase
MRGGSETGHDIVTIGCSAGGVEALPIVLGKLPRDTPAAFFVVMHVAAMSESFLPGIIGRSTKMPCAHAIDGEPIEHGRIYVAPPNRHLLLQADKVVVGHGPKENRHRPAVDPLFRSAAQYFGSRVIGVILTGSLDDGTAGLQAVKRCGGLAVVQHPDDALAPGMPLSAVQYVQVDHVVPIEKMGALLKRLISKPAGEKASAGCHEDASIYNQGATMTKQEMEARFGPPSALVCPECQGPIWEVTEDRHSQFRCLVGHYFSPESFVAEEAEAVERALWVAVKTLQERADLLKRLAEKSDSMAQTISAASFREKAQESQAHADVIRGILNRFDSASTHSSNGK